MRLRKKIVLFFIFCSINLLVKAENKRIVSLTPSLTNMVYLLDGQDNIVGSTAFCDKAIEDGKKVVASQMSVNIEKILNINPDYIITTKLTSYKDIERLRLTGLNVKVFDVASSFDELCDQFIQIGSLIGKKNHAKTIIDNQIKRLNKLQSKIVYNDKPEIFMQLGVKPLFTVISGTFMNDYISLSGGKNIASDFKRGTITRENVLIRDPDVIIIVMMGLTGEEEKQNWKRYSNLKAVKNNKIFIIDDDKACSPTPVTFVDTLEEIIGLIYM